MAKRLVLAAGLIVLVSACGEPTGSAPAVSAPSTTATTVAAEDAGTAAPGTTGTTVGADREGAEVEKPPPERVPSTTVPGVTGEAPGDLIESVVADLVARTGADPNDVTVAVDEFVIWSDGSLGCPQPGQMYTQALVEGYRIVLEHAGIPYDYHASQRGNFVLCEEKSAAAGGSASLIGRDPTGAAVSDLAVRLGVPESEVSVVSSQVLEVQIGVPCGPTAAQEEGALPGGLGVGTEVVLAAGGATHRYVAVSGRLTYCGP